MFAGLSGRVGALELSSSDWLGCGPPSILVPGFFVVPGTRHGGRRGGRVRQAGTGEGWKMSDHDGGRVGAVDLDGMTVQQLTALIAAAEGRWCINRLSR